MRRLLAPDLALAVSTITLLYCLFLFDGFHKLFRDSDTGWHIRTGEIILNTGALPRTDPYSFTKPGAEWYAWEWGSDVLMAVAHRMDGLRGVALLYGFAISACTWLWFRLHREVQGDFFLACAMAAPMLSTVNLHWLARPHVFSWILLLAAVWAAERAGARFRLLHFGAIVTGAALWANLHASFFLAPVLALIYAAGHALRPWIWETDAAADYAKARWFTLAAACAGVGTLVNPYGWRLHQHVARYLTNSELLERIGEYRSFNFHAEGAGQIVLALGIAGLGAAAALGQRRLAHALLGFTLIAMSLRAARVLPMVTLAVLPLANGAITAVLHKARGLRFRRQLDAVLAYSGRLRALDRRGRLSHEPANLLHCKVGQASSPVGWLLVPIIVAFTILSSRHTPAGFPIFEFPIAASAVVERLPESARLLAPDKFGGYLIYSDPRRKVFYDGRSDFYGVEFMKQYLDLVEVRPGWREQLEKHRFTHALLPVRYSLVPALQSAGWREIYRDKVAVLLEK